MTNNKVINNQQELMAKLEDTILKTSKSEIKIFAGHLPLLYIDNGPGKRQVKLGVDRWGKFSEHSFELGCLLVKYSLKIGKSAKIIIVVDDDDELERRENGKRKDHRKWKSPRKRLYEKVELPKEYEEILLKHNLDKSYLATIKKENKEIFLISERKIKNKAEIEGFVATNECSKAYKGMLFSSLNLFNPKKDYLISFIPGQCKGNICRGFSEKEQINFDSTHIFFPHAQKMGGLIFEQGKYIKIFPSWDIELIYMKGVEFKEKL